MHNIEYYVYSVALMEMRHYCLDIIALSFNCMSMRCGKKDTIFISAEEGMMEKLKVK